MKYCPDPWVLQWLGRRLQLSELLHFAADTMSDFDMNEVIENSDNLLHDQLRCLLWAGRGPPAEEPFRHQKAHWFQDVQWFVARGDGKGLLVASKAGCNGEMHNHNDVGNVVVYSPAGEAFIAELGRGDFSKQYFLPGGRYTVLEASSLGHNVPVANGHPQSFGKTFQASDVTWMETAEGWTWTAELAGAYPVDAGVVKLNRKLLVRHGNHSSTTAEPISELVLMDEYKLDGDSSLILEVLYTFADRVEAEDGQIRLTFTATGNTAIVAYDTAAWSVQVESVEDQLTRKRSYPVHRLVWKPLSNLSSGQWTVSIHSAASKL